MRPRATSSRISSGVEVFALGDELHLGGDDALAGGFELRHDVSRFPTPVRTGSGSRGVISAGRQRCRGTPSDALTIVRCARMDGECRSLRFAR